MRHGITRKRTAGITLIEMLVVVTIIALFSAIVTPLILSHLGDVRRQAARTQIDGFDAMLGAYKLDTGHYPTTEQGLQALRIRPAGVERWNGPYSRKDIPQDPWGHAYLYKYPNEHGDEPDIWSLGADGKEGGEKEDADVCSWRNN